MDNDKPYKYNPRARFTGVIYLLYFLIAVAAQYLTGHGLAKYGNLANILAYALYFVVTLSFYYLFTPVNKLISFIAAFVSLIGCIIGVFALFYPALSDISLLLFFGPYCLFIGYLIFRSTFLPQVLGIFMVLAGLGWLTYMSPLVNYLSIYIEITGIIAEGSLMLWLIIMGVNVKRWQEMAERKN